ncbi:MAG: A/G-specific adenine glycosylase [Myxococcales bacterium]|nr:A/G-specific adenine glycosylase [Myxococcales bacterium]
MSAEEHRERVRASLLDWYQAHRRELPWRKDSDPYAVWVSEMMLQQTQVATVIPYFERWLTLFPDVATLAAAEEADVLHAWQGLGYYSRARNLLKGARAVVSEHAGRVPADVEQLRALPGVGPYTAGAIASIAHNRAEPIVDGNVIRVLSRLYALEGDPTKAAPKRRLWELAAELVPASAPGDFNQALMELGATRCTPKKPACVSCPLSKECLALARNEVERFPETPPRVKTTSVHMLAAVIEGDGRFLMGKLASTAPRWSGMWQFPNAESQPGAASDENLRTIARRQTALEVEPQGLLGVVRHSVTRYRITLDAYRCVALPGEATPGGDFSELRWMTLEETTNVALPKAHAQIARALSEG